MTKTTTQPAMELPALTTIDELARTHSTSYASPHHFTLSCEGFLRMYAELTRASASSAAVGEPDAVRYRKLSARLIGADFDWNESGTSVLVFELPAGFRVSADCDAMVDALHAAPAAPAVDGESSAQQEGD